MAKEKRTSERKSGGLYRGVSIPVKVLNVFIFLGTAALVGIFIFAMIAR